MFLLGSLALLAPLAAAAEPVPVEGMLRFEGGLDLFGPTQVEAARGAVDLAPALLAGEASTMSWTSADGFEPSRVRVRSNMGSTSLIMPDESGTRSSERNRTFSLDGGHVRLLSCAEPCQALLFVAEEGRVAMEGEAAGALRWSDRDRSYFAFDDVEGAPYSFRYPVPAATVQAGASDSPTQTFLRDARATAAGGLGLFLSNVSGELVVGNETTPFTVGQTRTSMVGATGAVERVEESYLVLLMRNASWESAPGTAAVLVAPRPEVRVEGAVASASATGALEMGANDTALRSQPLRLEGSLGLSLQVERSQVAKLGRAELMDESTPEGALRGSATLVLVAGSRVAEARTDLAPYYAGAAVAAVLLAALAYLQHVAWAPLYSRISRSRVLANPNRLAVYEAIRARPGMNPSDLSREVGLARVVVQHHLRMLSAHQLVTSRASGRQLAFFAPEDLPSVGELKMRETLRDPTRRRIADELRGAPGGLTQAELTERTGIPQRLVSYHLAKLQEKGLAEGDRGFPQRYRARREGVENRGARA